MNLLFHEQTETVAATSVTVTAGGLHGLDEGCAKASGVLHVMPYVTTFVEESIDTCWDIKRLIET